MRNTSIRFVLLVALAVLICHGAACQRKSVVTSKLSTTVAGREIKAVVDGPAFIHPEEDGTTISLDSHKVAVEKEGVSLDGKELAKLPAAAKTVEVTVAAGQLTVTADGKNVAETRIGP